MVRLEWNALRVGDKVLVHDPGDSSMRLVPGTVALVQSVSGPNDVGIRMGPEIGRQAVLRPSRLSVHLDPRDPDEECWRCEAVAARS